jgi:hypothetical protein
MKFKSRSRIVNLICSNLKSNKYRSRILNVGKLECLVGFMYKDRRYTSNYVTPVNVPEIYSTFYAKNED